jgi:choline kinase
VSDLQGLVLAAGGGTRLKPLTDERPKTMLEVDGDRSILELAVANLAASGITEVVVVTGHAAAIIEAEAPQLERTYDVSLSLRHNARYAELNNAYSLWCVRDVLLGGALLINGDTVHPPEVERLLLDAPEAPLVLATDQAKRLGEEEMKVLLSPAGRLERISKLLDPKVAAGEYIGVARIGPSAGANLAAALEATFERDANSYYEDGFQEFIDRGGHIETLAIGSTMWVEVDDHADLARARDVTASWR